MRPRTGIAAFATLMTTAGVLAAAAAGATAAHASTTAHGAGRPGGFGQTRLIPGDLLVSTSYYKNDPSIVAGTTRLPPGCTGANCATAIANGNYPYVFNNDSVDGSFGVVSPLYLKQITPGGFPQGVIPVPTNELNTSFSSKSEGALNLSPDGKTLTFIDYAAPVDTVDASNANTPGVIDPTNPVPGAYYRAVAQLSANGKFTFTETNAYSGNNGRAAVTASVDGKDYIYTAGNAGNGANPQPAGVVLGAGAQIITPSDPAGGGPDARPAHAGRQLQRHPAPRQGGQGRQGRQLPRPDPLQQRPVLHQGQRRQRRQHRVLPRHHRHRVPGRRRRSGRGGEAADRRDRVHPDLDRPGQQHVHPQGVPDRARQGRHRRERLPVRSVVRQPDHAVPGRRGRRRQHLRQRFLHRGRGLHHGRPAEVGLQLHRR